MDDSDLDLDMDEVRSPRPTKVYTFFRALHDAVSILSFVVGMLLKWFISPLLIGYSIGYYTVLGFCQLSSQISCPAESPYASFVLGPGLLLIGRLLITGHTRCLWRWVGPIVYEMEVLNCVRYSPFILPVIAILMYTPAPMDMTVVVNASEIVFNGTVEISSTYVGCATTILADFFVHWTLLQCAIGIVTLWLTFNTKLNSLAAALVFPQSYSTDYNTLVARLQERIHRQRRMNYFAVVLASILLIVGSLLIATLPTMTYYYMQLDLLTSRSELYIVATFVLAILLIVTGTINILVFIASDKMFYTHLEHYNGIYYVAAPLLIICQLIASAFLVERVLTRNYDRYCYKQLSTDVSGGRKDFDTILEHDWILHGAIAAICALLILCYKIWCEFGYPQGRENWVRDFHSVRNVEDEKSKKTEANVDLTNGMDTEKRNIEQTNIKVQEDPVHQSV